MKNFRFFTRPYARSLVTEVIAKLEDIPDDCAECFTF